MLQTIQLTDYVLIRNFFSLHLGFSLRHMTLFAAKSFRLFRDVLVRGDLWILKVFCRSFVMRAIHVNTGLPTGLGCGVR